MFIQKGQRTVCAVIEREKEVFFSRLIWWISEAPRNQGGAVFSCLQHNKRPKLLKLKIKTLKRKLVDKM